MAKTKKRKVSPGDVATNRQASFRYNLIERYEAGMMLTGTEVKSLREGKAQLKDSYAAMARSG
jgi:SsrA-binding protein